MFTSTPSPFRPSGPVKVRLLDRISFHCNAGLALTMTLTTLISACGGGGSSETTSAPLAETSPAMSSSQALTPETIKAIALESASRADGTSSKMPRIDDSKIPTGSPGVSVKQVARTNELPTTSDIGNFRTVCDFSHMNYDDPIVFPGQPGASHLHAFFGNSTTNANSSYVAGIGNSTCRGGTINRSGYWIPAMIDTRNGAPLKPSELSVYYKTGYRGITPATVQPFPKNLRMVMGFSGATGPVDGSYTAFRCQGGKRETGAWSNSIPDCMGDEDLLSSQSFPQCWDGANLDSPDHKSHMTYPTNGKCPTTHPVPVPEITYGVTYHVGQDHATAGWRLASDNYDTSQPGGYSSHADWFNGWDQEILIGFVKGCLQTSLDCHSHLLGDGQKMY